MRVKTHIKDNLIFPFGYDALGIIFYIFTHSTMRSSVLLYALALGCRLVRDECVDELTGQLIERMVSVEVRIR